MMRMFIYRSKKLYALATGFLLIAAVLLTSCAFGNADAVQSLFTSGNSHAPLFIAGGIDIITASNNGSVWTPSLISGTNFNVASIAYGKGTYVAVGDIAAIGGWVMVSKDGLIWFGPWEISTDNLYIVTFYNGKFIAGGRDNMYISMDGLAWAPVLNVAGGITGLAAAGDRVVAIGMNNMPPNHGIAFVSFDGLAWIGPIDIDSDTTMRVLFANGRFVAAGSTLIDAISVPAVFTSMDGLTWATIPLSRYTTGYTYSVAYGGGKFIAGSSIQGTTFGSLDGFAWAPVLDNDISRVLWDITYCDGRFVAADSYTDPSPPYTLHNSISYSIDGMFWQHTGYDYNPSALNCVMCRD